MLYHLVPCLCLIEKGERFLLGVICEQFVLRFLKGFLLLVTYKGVTSRFFYEFMSGLFLSVYNNKIDKKLRVSVPSNFRNVLADSSFQGVVLYKSVLHNCIEGCSMERLSRISESIDNLDIFSDERDAFATAILGNSFQATFDPEGRILLPKQLIEMTKLEENATFVGKGQTFEIWHPALFQSYSEQAQKLAVQSRAMLKLTKSTDQ